MQTIVFNSQKGGSGKSALCRVLSVQAARAEAPERVFLVDLDAQRTLTQRHEARTADEPRRVVLSIEALGEGLTLLAERGTAYVFVDTPPHATEILDPVFMPADLVIIPVKATPDDLKAAAVTVSRLKRLERPFLFVITQAIANANITAQAIAALSHHGPVAETVMANRVSYPAAFTDGRTPQEIEPKGPAAREVAKLWAGVQGFLDTHPLPWSATAERNTAHG